MNKYAHIDENNIIKGWYDDSHTSIPEPKIKVSNTNWENAIANNHNYCSNDGVTKIVQINLTTDQQINKCKNYLLETDWYILRNQETGAAIPSEVTTKRTEARQTINDLEG